MEKYGAVMAPRNGRRGRQIPNIQTASLEAPAGSQEHRLAIKRGHYTSIIPEVRGCNETVSKVYKRN